MTPEERDSRIAELLGELDGSSHDAVDQARQAARTWGSAEIGDLVETLVDDGHLTVFQGREIRAGRGDALLLGNYVLLDPVGEGGMGQVYRASHRRMDREVALKVLKPSGGEDDDAIKRFVREVRLASRLSHQNVVTVHDADESDGVHYLVMELVDGRDLASLVAKAGPLTVGRALDCTIQAARGLAYAHSQGVVHRDVKPHNLLLDNRGTVKLLDLGLARLSEDTSAQAALTGTGMVMGTIDYMSPEQATDTRAANARSDVYSLGMTLYFLLTGRPAFTGDTVTSRLLAHQNQPVPDLPDHVPAEVNAAFQRMVEKSPEGRFQSMEEVVAALERCMTDSEGAIASWEESRDATIHWEEAGSSSTGTTMTVADPAAVGGVASEQPSRRPSWLGLAAVAALALVLLAAIIRPWERKAGGPDPAQAGTNDSEDRPADGSEAPEDLAALTDRQIAERLIGLGFAVSGTDTDKRFFHTIASVDDLPESVASITIVGGPAATVLDVPPESLNLLAHLDALESVELPVTELTPQHVAQLKGLRIRSVELRSQKKSSVADPQLEELFASLPRLDSVVLTGLQVTGECLGGIVDPDRLTRISLNAHNGVLLISVDAIRALTRSRLEGVYLRKAALGPDHLAAIGELKSLRSLSLPTCSFPASSIGELGGLDSLETLGLNSTSVGDDQIATLSRLRNLTTMGLVGTKLTKEGVERLRKALPRCRFTTDFGDFEPLEPEP